MDMLTQGFIAALTALYLFSYIGFRRVFAFAFIVDVVMTITFVCMFAGSYAGMMTGVIAGLIFSIVLRVGRRLLGCERPHLIRGYGHILPTLVWVRSK